MRMPLSTKLRRLVMGSGIILAACVLTRAAQAQELRDQYHQAPRDTVSQEVYDGWKQYNLNCARCHGEDVLGTTIAPHLIVSLKPDGPINTQEAFVQVVCAGRPEKGMPSWCALGLEMDKINQIYAYVKGRSDAKLAPGRPEVKRAG
jgi:mono/diheme cytochrome c family protein